MISLAQLRNFQDTYCQDGGFNGTLAWCCYTQASPSLSHVPTLDAHIKIPDISCALAQPKPITYYTWDLWLLSEGTAGFKPKSFGILDVAPSSECQDGTCLGLQNDTYLELPSHNFGQYPSLSFSFWFRPSAQSGKDARIIDFGGSVDQGNIVIARQAATQDIMFIVSSRAPARTSSAMVTRVWDADMWRHVVWTLDPIPNSANAVWQIYIDGAWLLKQSGLYPISAELSGNYIGKSNVLPDGGFWGYIDSFFIFQTALSAEQVVVMYKVGSDRTCHECFLLEIWCSLMKPLYSGVA